MHAAAAARTAKIKTHLLNRLQEAGQKTRGSTLISHFGLDAANGGSPSLPDALPTRAQTPPWLPADGGDSLSKKVGVTLFVLRDIHMITATS